MGFDPTVCVCRLTLALTHYTYHGSADRRQHSEPLGNERYSGDEDGEPMDVDDGYPTGNRSFYRDAFEATER